MAEAITDLKFPTGKYEPADFSESLLKERLNEIRILPKRMEDVVQHMSEEQLNTPYREGGWKVKQLVHHVADSHMNAYIRFRLALTEDNPTIKPYEEKLWAELRDSETVPVNVSLTLLHALHIRWYETIKDLTPEQWERTVYHPELKRSLTLWWLLGLYAWHGKHHVGHAMLVSK